MALIIAPCGGVAAEEPLFEPPLRESPVLEIAREHAGPGRVRDWSRRLRGPDPRQAVRQARAALFAADGLLEVELDPAKTAALSALKRRLLAALTWPGSAPACDAEVHHLVAMLAFRLGDSSESLRHAARAALAAPSSSRYHSNFAFFLHTARHVQQARVVYEHARRLDPDNTATHLGLLSVAADSAHLDLDEVEALVRDWYRRERVPELGRMADTLTQVLSRLAKLGLPVESGEHDSTAEEVRLVRAMLRELLGSPNRAASRPVSPPARAPESRAGSTRSSRRVRDGLSYRVGGSEP